VHSGVFGPATPYASVGDPIDASKFTETAALIKVVYDKITEMRETHPDRVKLRAKGA
jgi:hypothetical protein